MIEILSNGSKVITKKTCRVKRPGKLPDGVYECCCVECLCSFTATDEDVKVTPDAYKLRYVICPECGTANAHSLLPSLSDNDMYDEYLKVD